MNRVLTGLVFVSAEFFKSLRTSGFQPENTEKCTFLATDGKSYWSNYSSVLCVPVEATSTPKDLGRTSLKCPTLRKASACWLCCRPRSSPSLHCWLSPPHEQQDQRQLMWAPEQQYAADPAQFIAIAQTDLKEPPMDAWSIKGKFCKNNNVGKPHVSHILQKSKLEVTEDGTRDSASITRNLITRSLPPWFIVERPFLSFIQHNPTSVVLLRQQTNPEEYTKETMQSKDYLSYEEKTTSLRLP